MTVNITVAYVVKYTEDADPTHTGLCIDMARPQQHPIAFATREAAQAYLDSLGLNVPTGYTYDIIPLPMDSSIGAGATLVNERDALRAALDLAHAERNVAREEMQGLRESLDFTSQQLRDVTSRMEAGWTQAVENRTNHEADIARIGERLIQEADDRGWCSVYDDVVEDVNRYLNISLPTRLTDYDVTYTYEVTVTHTISARDSSAAYQNDPTPTPSELREAINNGDYTEDRYDVSESED